MHGSMNVKKKVTLCRLVVTDVSKSVTI